MRIRVVPLILCYVMPFLGCGAGNFVNSITATPDLSGNWEFASQLGTVAGSVPTAPTAGLLLVGSLTSQGSNVTGIFRLGNLGLPNLCGTPLQQVVTVSGTIDSSRNLTLTSTAFSGSVLTMQLAVPPTIGPVGAGATFTTVSGTIAIVGGTCAFPSAGAFGFEIASLTGTFAGQLTDTAPLPGSIAAGTVSLVLTQAKTPQPDGQIPIAGTLSFNGGGCTSSVAVSGTVSGNLLTIASAGSGIFNIPVDYLNAAIDPISGGLTILRLSYGLGPCNVGYTASALYTGTLTRQ